MVARQGVAAKPAIALVLVCLLRFNDCYTESALHGVPTQSRCPVQEAAEADAKAKLEEQAKLERQERPAAQPSENAEEPSTAGPAKLSRASSDDEPSSELPRPNGTAQVRTESALFAACLLNGMPP